MTAIPSSEVTLLLDRLAEGETDAPERLLPLVYNELRSMAASLLRNERRGHTLQPTALVHEAFLRLVDQTQATFRNRAHFCAVAATAMRRILVDHARQYRTRKRGGDRVKLCLEQDLPDSAQGEMDLVDLDEAMQRLAALDERKHRVVELRFFGGLTNESVAHVLGVSRKTVVEDWSVARLWLRRELSCRAAV